MPDAGCVIGSESCVYAFDASVPPVTAIDPGSIVRFETGDETLARIAGGEPLEAIGFEKLSPVTGPVLIRGAEPGDALRITVLEIDIHRVWSLWVPQFGPLGGRTTALQAKQLMVEGDRIHIDGHLSVRLDPMIGCVGVAPAEGSASSMRPVYRTGGNLDLRELSPGAVLWLPVEASGALLSLGDLHAAMGQGEPTIIALEAAGAATVRIDVEHNSSLTSPRLRTGSKTICVGMGETHLEAKQDAILQAFDLLTQEHGLEPFAAYAYTSAQVELRLAGPSGTMVDGLQAVLAAVPDPDD